MLSLYKTIIAIVSFAILGSASAAIYDNSGTVNAIDLENGQITIENQNYTLADDVVVTNSNDIAVSRTVLQPNNQIQYTKALVSGEYVIDKIKITSSFGFLSD